MKVRLLSRRAVTYAHKTSNLEMVVWWGKMIEVPRSFQGLMRATIAATWLAGYRAGKRDAKATGGTA